MRDYCTLPPAKRGDSASVTPQPPGDTTRLGLAVGKASWLLEAGHSGSKGSSDGAAPCLKHRVLQTLSPQTAVPKPWSVGWDEWKDNFPACCPSFCRAGESTDLAGGASAR